MKIRKRLLSLLVAGVFLAGLITPFISTPTCVIADDPTVQVVASSDDCRAYKYANAAYTNFSLTENFAVGTLDGNTKGIGSGARFLDVTVPQGATISEARLQLRCDWTDGAGVVTGILTGEDIDSAPTFTNLGDFTSRVHTDASVTWSSLGAWTAGTWYNSPDIKTVVEEIVGRGGWSSGNDMVIFLEDEARASSGWRRASSYDGAPTYAPKLYISYSVTPAVETDDASGVIPTGATLSGDLVSMSGFSPIYCYFQHGLTDSYGSSTDEQERYSTGTFHEEILDLDTNQTYHFRAVALYDTDQYVYGIDKTFYTEEAGGGGGWLPGFSFRQRFKVTRSTVGDLGNYQYLVTVHSGAGASDGSDIYLDSNADNWPNDIRFTTVTGETSLDYYLQDFDADIALVWVELNFIPESPAETPFYIFYGNANASSASSGTDTFLFFNDFSTNPFTSVLYTSDKKETSVYLQQDGILYCQETYWSAPSRLFKYNIASGVKTVVFEESYNRFTMWASDYDEENNCIWITGEHCNAGNLQDYMRLAIFRWDLTDDTVQEARLAQANSLSEGTAIIRYEDYVYAGSCGTGDGGRQVWRAPVSGWENSANWGVVWHAAGNIPTKFFSVGGNLYLLKGADGKIYKYSGGTFILDTSLPCIGTGGWATASDAYWQTGWDDAYVVYRHTGGTIHIGKFNGNYYEDTDTGISNNSFGLKLTLNETRSTAYIFKVNAIDWEDSSGSTYIYKCNVDGSNVSLTQQLRSVQPSWILSNYGGEYCGQHLPKSLASTSKIIHYTSVSSMAIGEGQFAWDSSNEILRGYYSASSRAWTNGIHILNPPSQDGRFVSVKLRVDSGEYVAVQPKWLSQGNCIMMEARAWESSLRTEIYTGGAGGVISQAAFSWTGSTWFRVLSKVSDAGKVLVDIDGVNKLNFTSSYCDRTWTGVGLSTYLGAGSFDDLFVGKYIVPEPSITDWQAEEEATESAVDTKAASDKATTTATLNATITSVIGGNASDIGFQWGLTSSYGADWSDGAGDPYGVGDFDHGITTLTPNTTYHFRAFIIVDGETIRGEDLTFLTVALGAPSVTTGEAATITNNSALLQGALDSLGDYDPVYVSFEYGITTSYVAAGSPTANQVKAAVDTFNAPISNLSPGVVYHFRARVEANGNYFHGLDNTFKTAIVPPPSPQTPTQFTATGTDSTIVLTWLRGVDSTKTLVRYSTSSYPLSISEGNHLYLGVDLTCTLSDVISDQTYYFSAWGEHSGVYSTARAIASSVPEIGALTFPDFVEIVDAKVYSEYLENGDQLYTIRYKLIYSSGNPLEDCSDYFQFQIMEGSTVKASYPVKSWGYRVGSIWLSAPSALTWQGEYKIRLVGYADKWTTPPEDTWYLSLGDWQGSELTNLDSWCIYSAEAIQSYYDTALVDYGAEGSCINDQGAIIFSMGIPSIRTERPNIFCTETALPPPELDEHTREYETTWSTDRLGTYIPGVLESGAGMLGISAINLGGFIIFLLWLAVVVLVGMGSGNALVGMGLGVPIVIGGAFFGLVPGALIMILSAVTVMFGVYYIWIRGV